MSNSFGENLKKYRLENGLSQSAFADELSYHIREHLKKTDCDYEYNTSNVYASSLYSVCKREYISTITELNEQIERLNKDYDTYGKFAFFGHKNSGAVRAAIKAYYSYCKWKDIDKWRM